MCQSNAPQEVPFLFVNVLKEVLPLSFVFISVVCFSKEECFRNGELSFGNYSGASGGNLQSKVIK